MASNSTRPQVVTFSDARLVEWLETQKRDDESASLCAKRLLNEYREVRAQAPADDQNDVDAALVNIEHVGQVLRRLRARYGAP